MNLSQYTQIRNWSEGNEITATFSVVIRLDDLGPVVYHRAIASLQ
jgi:hypothetical protein